MTAPAGFGPAQSTSSGPPLGFGAPETQQQPPAQHPGTDFGAAIGHAITHPGELFGPAVRAVESVQQGLLDAQHHPIEEAMNVLGAPQRGIGELARQAEGHGSGNPYADVLESVFSPSDAVNARTTESIRALVHAPTHEAIDTWVEGLPGLTKDERDWAKTIGEAGEDFTLQTISDPLTLLDGVGAVVHFGGMFIRGSKVADAMYKAAQSVKMGRAFEHLTGTADAYAQGATSLQKAAREIRNAGIRPDIDKYATLDGKRQRLSIENKWYNRIGQAAPEDQRLLDAAAQGDTAATDALRDRYLNYLYRTGSKEDQQILAKSFGVQPPQGAVPFVKDRFDENAQVASIRNGFLKRGQVPSAQDIAAQLAKRRSSFEAARTKSLKSQIANFLNGSPEEQLKDLNTTRAHLRDGMINAEFAALARRNPSILKEGVIPEYDKLPTSDPLKQKLRTMLDSAHVPMSEKLPFTDGKGFSLGDLLQAPRVASRFSITVKPWIHEIRNVGQLARMAGGLHMVPWALWHAAKYAGGASVEDIARLDRIGGLPTFFHNTDANLLARVPGFRQLQDAMERVDIGYRAALMKTLDKVEGGSADSARIAVEREYGAADKAIDTPAFKRDVQTRTVQNELLKGRSISERIGDPRNQDAIVNLFEAFGGYYPVFRLGIVPRNVMATFLEHPGRVVLPLREQADLNARRRARDATEYVMGGPTTDAAEMAESTAGIAFGQPPRYYTSPATSGLLGAVVQAPYGDAGQSPLGTATRIGGALLPGGYDAQDIINAANGQLPDAPPQLRDKLALWLYNFLTGNYERKQPNERIQAGEEHQIEREYPQ